MHKISLTLSFPTISIMAIDDATAIANIKAMKVGPLWKDLNTFAVATGFVFEDENGEVYPDRSATKRFMKKLKQGKVDGLSQMDLSCETIPNELNLHYTTKKLQKGKVIEYKWNDELKKVDVHNPSSDFYFYKVSVSINDSHLNEMQRMVSNLTKSISTATIENIYEEADGES